MKIRERIKLERSKYRKRTELKMFAENARLFEYYVRIRVLCAYFCVKDWRQPNMIWDALYNTGDMVISIVFQ